VAIAKAIDVPLRALPRSRKALCAAIARHLRDAYGQPISPQAIESVVRSDVANLPIQPALRVAEFAGSAVPYAVIRRDQYGRALAGDRDAQERLRDEVAWVARRLASALQSEKQVAEYYAEHGSWVEPILEAENPEAYQPFLAIVPSMTPTQLRRVLSKINVDEAFAILLLLAKRDIVLDATELRAVMGKLFRDHAFTERQQNELLQTAIMFRTPVVYEFLALHGLSDPRSVARELLVREQDYMHPSDKENPYFSHETLLEVLADEEYGDEQEGKAWFKYADKSDDPRSRRPRRGETYEEFKSRMTSLLSMERNADDAGLYALHP